MVDWPNGIPILSVAVANAGHEFIPTFWIPDIIGKVYEERKFSLGAGRLDIPNGRGDNFNLKIMVGLDSVGTNLSAGTKIPMGSLTYKTVVGTINPWGRGVSLETRLLKLAPHDLRAQAAKWSLAKDIVDCFENTVRDRLMVATTNGVYGGTYATIGFKNAVIFGTYAQGKMTSAAIKRASTRLAKSNTPGVFPDGSWLLFLSCEQMDDLFDETATGGFVDISKYTDRGFQRFTNFEAGMLYNFRIGRTNRLVGTKESGAAGTVQCCDALGYGGNASAPAFAFVWGEGGEPQFGYEPNYDGDFNRTQAWAWMADGEVSKIFDEYIVRIHTTVNVDITASGL